MYNISANISVPHDGSISIPDEYPLLEDTEFYMNSRVIPALAVFGVIGNILNLIILSYRYSNNDTDTGEKSALLGLMALAVSDFFFCLGTIPSAFFDGFRTIFHTNSIWMYYQVYGVFYQNVFIKTSTCLTTIIAFGRYIAICHPLKFRFYNRVSVTKITLCVVVLIWISLNLPLLWTFCINQLPLGNNSFIYIIDTGYLTKNESLRISCTYVWALLGYFIPFVLLAFCNINLIKALRRSQMLRQNNARFSNHNNSNRSRITITLIALTTMYLILVSPSEILHFYMDATNSKSKLNLERAIIVSNFLQMVNFSCHFILYCAVNSHFRSIILNLCRKGTPNTGFVCTNHCSSASYRAYNLQDNTMPLNAFLEDNEIISLKAIKDITELDYKYVQKQ